MTETDTSPEFPQEPEINRPLAIARLKELGVDIELEDLLDEDDNDLLGIIGTYAYMYGGDIDEFFDYVEIPVALRRDP